MLLRRATSATRSQTRTLACTTKRLLGILIIVSLGAVVYEIIDISWGSYAGGDWRRHEKTKLFHLREGDNTNDQAGWNGSNDASMQINSSSARTERYSSSTSEGSNENEETSYSNFRQEPIESEENHSGNPTEILSESISSSASDESIQAEKRGKNEEKGFQEVSAADLLHVSLLQEICLDSQEAIIPWQYGAPRNGSDQDTTEDRKLLAHRSDLRLIQVLKDCPDVDIFVPGGLRSHGYCEDGAAYTKYLKSRMLPRWVFTDVFYDATGRGITYNEICPKTPIIYFNHYWDGIPELTKEKPMYLMPNIEMYELRETHLWRADVVLCKTMSCYTRVTQWYKQEGNPRSTQVIYTKHTTSDVAHFARYRLLKNNESATMKTKDFKNVRFVHTAGSSGWKGTRNILRCWMTHRNLPPLDVYIRFENLQSMFEAQLLALIQRNSNIRIVLDKLDAMQFGRIMAESAFFLCPSQMEGYGHYINQARATGGVIITTQAEPMNELVPSTDMGVYVKTHVDYDEQTFLGGAFSGSHGLRGVEGLIANFKPESLCATVDEIAVMPEHEREMKAARIRQQYHIDTNFFAAVMGKLRVFARRTI